MAVCGHAYIACRPLILPAPLSWMISQARMLRLSLKNTLNGSHPNRHVPSVTGIVGTVT
jgi:hypothetical protein